MSTTTFSSIIGKTLTSATATDDELLMIATTGEQLKLHHKQGCCESVAIESIDGDLADLVGYPIVMAEETVGDQKETNSGLFTHTWTFYKFATQKGYVTVRWLGESNGNYSEKVDTEYKDAEGVQRCPVCDLPRLDDFDTCECNYGDGA